MTENQVQLRRQARLLLDLSAPRDALAAYYALYHNPARTRLYIAEREGKTEGFLVVCQTGQDLFQQQAVLRARNEEIAMRLLDQGLYPRRPYYLIITPELHIVAGRKIDVERAEVNRIYRLDLGRYRPAVNVLVVSTVGPNGLPRFVIRSGEQTAAESGINWQSPHFAELYVWTAPEARERGWGKTVVESCAAAMIRAGVQPLYTVSEGNKASIGLAESIGFVDSGGREFAVEGMARG